MRIMRRYRTLPAVLLAIILSALVGGLFGRSALATDDTQNKLRGPKGTTVHIDIKRRGYSELIPLDVTRDEVFIPTVPASFMIDATTGYVRLQDFGENTDHDVRGALRELASKGMRR